MNEIRNELLLLIPLVKKEDKKIYFDMLLERFESDLKKQKEDLKYKLKEIDDNIELLEYVKKEIKGE